MSGMPLLALLLLQAADVPVRVALETKGSGCAEVRLSASASRRQAHVNEGQVFVSKSGAWSAAKGWELVLTGVPVGRRLLLATWSRRSTSEGRDVPTHYVDARWIDVQAAPPETALEIAPSRSGTVVVEPAEGVARAGVSFVPADVDGSVPDWSQRPEGPAFSAPLRDGRAVFPGMKPGRYLFYPTGEHPDRPAPTVTRLVEVKAGETVRAPLGR